MAEITAALVNELRAATNLPMMKCKQALTASGGDIQAAIEWLRKQGAAAGAKFGTRDTPCGATALAIGAGAGVAILVGCQTDFVGKNDAFRAFVQQVADLALASGADSVDALNAQKLDGVALPDAFIAQIQKIGENIKLVGVKRVVGESISGYNHDGRIAALASGSGDVTKLKQVALHVASANPVPVGFDRASVDPALVEKEKEIIAATPDVQAKPEAMRPKIVEGKLGRFFKESVLLEQEMLFDAEKGESVEKYAKRVGITLTGFARLQAGS
jgi:elongation factor Ts